MSEVKKFSLKNKGNNDKYEFIFYCRSRSTRHGFAHDAELFVNGFQIDSATCHYLNRTWENYTYQSVMKKLVSAVIDRLDSDLRNDFLARNGYIRFTEKRQEEYKRDFLHFKFNFTDETGLITIKIHTLNMYYELYKML